MTERQSIRMSKIKNGGIDKYGTEHFEHILNTEQQQSGTAGAEGVNSRRCNTTEHLGSFTSETSLSIQTKSDLTTVEDHKVKSAIVSDTLNSQSYTSMQLSKRVTDWHYQIQNTGRKYFNSYTNYANVASEWLAELQDDVDDSDHTE